MNKHDSGRFNLKDLVAAIDDEDDENIIQYKCSTCQIYKWGRLGSKPNCQVCSRCKAPVKIVPREKWVGLGHFRCLCGRTFVGKARKVVHSKCYACGNLCLPWKIRPMGEVKRKSDLTHHCELCHGSGSCPIAGNTSPFRYGAGKK